MVLQADLPGRRLASGGHISTNSGAPRDGHAVGERADLADGPVPDLSVCVPCYNEEQVLPDFHRRMLAECQRLAAERGTSFEIVYVNDGSRDGTLQLLNELSGGDERIAVVNLSRNHGHQLALTAGLTCTRGRRVLILDADLQDPPELAGPMLQQMQRDRLDVVYGKRRRRAGETAFKRFTAAAFYRVIDRLTETPIPADTGDFRLISRRALEALLSMPERHRFIRGMVSWVGFAQAPHEYDRDARYAGETKYPLRRMLAFAIDAITSFSIKPLRLATVAGAVFAGVLAPLLLVYSILSWAVFETAPGWTSLLCAIALLGGIQLLVLGIIGEYVGRIYEQSKGRPLFIIESVARGARPPAGESGEAGEAGGAPEVAGQVVVMAGAAGGEKGQ